MSCVFLSIYLTGEGEETQFDEFLLFFLVGLFF